MPSFVCFLSLELWDISFYSYDLMIYTNVLCTYINSNCFLQKNKIWSDRVHHLFEIRNPHVQGDTHFQLATISKWIIEKGPDWWHSLCLFEFFLDLTNLLNFHSQGALQRWFKSGSFWSKLSASTENLYIQAHLSKKNNYKALLLGPVRS
jgi:hypothetical protein